MEEDLTQKDLTFVKQCKYMSIKFCLLKEHLLLYIMECHGLTLKVALQFSLSHGFIGEMFKRLKKYTQVKLLMFLLSTEY